MNFWNFPSALGGNINSINDAGIETFRNNVVEGKVREDIQNSLDAVKDRTKPVMVEFSHFTLDITNFPGKNELINVFKNCKDTWKGKNKKSEEFIEQSLNILQRNKIDFLRISDFNTTGLVGAESAEIGSPWSSLVKESGSSNKGDSSGGSFGIGKAASFLASDLRTIYYSSFADDGYESHIGVSNIMSFRKQNNEITLGKGYYTNKNESTAINGLINLDPKFIRKETGTDIYVSAFYPKSDWKKEMLHSVVKNFFITIIEKKLVVKINDMFINHENIGELILQLEDNEENRVLKNYYLLLHSKNVRRFSYSAFEYKGNITFKEGEAELFLMDGENLNRRVLMTRETGMFIYEQKNLSGSISFTGLLRITGKSMNKVFKEMENPAHNEWVANRFHNPSLAKKILQDLRKFIRETIKDTYTQSNSEVMDAVGLSDFLPNQSLISSEGTIDKESITSRVKSINSSKKTVEKPKKKSRSKEKKKSEEVEELLGTTGIEAGNQGEEETETETGTGNETGNTSKDNNDRENDREKDAERKQNSTNTISITSKQKYLCTDKKSGKYKFNIITEKSIQNGRLEFIGIGEQSDFDLPLKNAIFNNEDIEIENISANAINFKSKNKNKNLNLTIEIEYPEYCTMEVSVYEVK
ncbi:hypothetical protein ACFVRR_18240 [Gottfriedia sp. NPDC057948]|uniref:hypothetical protein n=1 Tax=Gottfriedia sp. NPDC057948 TaxID=3346287 RepID=UPI0036D9D6E0